MALNYIWIGFLLIAFLVGLVKLIFLQNYEVFPQIVSSIFEMSRTGFELSIYLTGVMAFWLGIMKIGEAGGIIHFFSKLIKPFFSRLFPEIPDEHPATASIIMNFSANLLGLDNAATPLGLKAMQELQELNPIKDIASNAQIMFLCLNASGLSIIPLTILIDRSVVGASNPTDIFLPILISTSASTITALIIVSLYQKINLFNKVVLSYMGGFLIFLIGIIIYFSILPQDKLMEISSVTSNLIIFSVIIGFVLLGVVKKVNVYEAFIDGAKEGFAIAVKIIPYLIAILVAVGVFRTSGALDYIIQGISGFVSMFGLNTDFVQALPTALMKPLSGSAARGMNLEVMKTFGPDSFVGRLSCIFRGAAETTFYILAVYFGSVNIKKTRYSVPAALIADLAGIIAGIFVAYLFFH
jgi:spore maturation protein SpmA